MIYCDLCVLHNTAELFDEAGQTPANGTTAPPFLGLRMQRVCESVRAHLNQGSQARMLAPASAEIRFVADGPVRITLSRPDVDDHGSPSDVFHGDFRNCGERPVVYRQPTSFVVSPHPRIDELRERLADIQAGRVTTNTQTPRFSFDPGVTRIKLDRAWGPIRLHGIEPAPGVTCRPPHADETPARTLLSYGTSITEGAGASLSGHEYPAVCARELGLDLINLGSSGSAYCEPQLADDIAERGQRGEWDVCTLALSVNMQWAEQGLFRERTSYMVDRVAGLNPDKPVFAITLWPYWRDLCVSPSATAKPNPEHPSEAPNAIPALAKRMRQDLRDAVANANGGRGWPNLRVLEGPELFGPFGGLSCDLIHPSDEGMRAMGTNLANAIRPHLPDN
ncbi:MAG: GDSL-type esterase/lipase family protein [Planctomycetota bacterium]